MADATVLIAEIGVRFEAGDPAPELVDQLESRLAVLAPPAELPDELRADIAALLARVEATVSAGAEWLAQAGPELASKHTQQRLRRAYGVP